MIPGGRFDPFVGLFQGTGPTALFLDGTADKLTNFTSEPPACPPAGLVTSACGASPGTIRESTSGSPYRGRRKLAMLVNVTC